MRIVLANALPLTITANVAEIKLPPAWAVLLCWTSVRNVFTSCASLISSLDLTILLLSGSLYRVCIGAPRWLQQMSANQVRRCH